MKYVDDCICVLTNIKLGTRFKDNRLKWVKEYEEEDVKNGVSIEANTLGQFAAMASSMLNCLNFIHHAPEANQKGRMPVLDTELWMGLESMTPGVPR